MADPASPQGANLDARTVEGFGREWSRFDQSRLDEAELRGVFERYFSIFPWQTLPPTAEGFDLGCGTGRWARFVAPLVGRLHCIDASAQALQVARANLGRLQNCTFHHADVAQMPIRDGSMDFGYSLGVLHHVPDPAAGLRDCVRKLKPGAPFLVYLYYAFDMRPWWFRAIWRLSDGVRRVLSRLPFALRVVASGAIATLAYWPLARTARLFEKMGARVEGWPLAYYRRLSFYTMRTDSLDRFGTALEQRFTRLQVQAMMEAAGLADIRFREDTPYWCAVGRRV